MIKPIVYKKTETANPHQAITDSVAKFVEVLNSGLLGQAQRIQSILQSPPPLEGEDSDFLKFSLFNPDTAQIFFRHARPPNVEVVPWLKWLEKHQVLKPLLNPKVEIDNAAWQLSFWLSEQFVADHSQELLGAIHRNGGRLHRCLCHHIYGVLFRRNAKKSIDFVFSQWTALLLSQGEETLSREELGLLGINCQIPADKTVAVLLFDRLTYPSVILDEELSFTSNFEEVAKKVTFSLNIFDDRDMWTAGVWENVLKPNLPFVALELEPIVSSNLATAHSLMDLANTPNYDPLYFERESVESSGTIRKLLDVLIDAARDIIIYLVQCDSAKASALIERWFAFDAAILRRLAVFGYSIRRDLPPDEKLKWLLQNELLYRFHAEVRAVLKDSYGLSSHDIRTNVLDSALNGPTDNLSDEDSRVERIYRLLMRLSRFAPDCSLTSRYVNSFLEQYPQFIRNEETQRAESRTSGRFMREDGDFDIDKIGVASPADFLEETLGFQPAQTAYLAAVSRVTERNPAWGVKWLRELILRSIEQPSLWTCVVQGWKAADLDPEGWHAVLVFSMDLKWAAKEFFLSLVELLVDGSKRESYGIPDTEMERAQQLAERIWREALSATLSIKIQHPTIG